MLGVGYSSREEALADLCRRAFALQKAHQARPVCLVVLTSTLSAPCGLVSSSGPLPLTVILCPQGHHGSNSITLLHSTIRFTRWRELSQVCTKLHQRALAHARQRHGLLLSGRMTCNHSFLSRLGGSLLRAGTIWGFAEVHVLQ